MAAVYYCIPNKLSCLKSSNAVQAMKIDMLYGTKDLLDLLEIEKNTSNKVKSLSDIKRIFPHDQQN